jgi:hypothetical protein
MKFPHLVEATLLVPAFLTLTLPHPHHNSSLPHSLRHPTINSSRHSSLAHSFQLRGHDSQRSIQPEHVPEVLHMQQPSRCPVPVLPFQRVQGY